MTAQNAMHKVLCQQIFFLRVYIPLNTKEPLINRILKNANEE